MRRIFAALLLSLFVFSCQKYEQGLLLYIPDTELFGIIESMDATRTSMDENNNVLWSEDDQIVAFMKSTLGTRYQIKEQYVGTTTGGFSKINESSGDDLESGQEIDHNVVLYPYSTAVWCMKNDNGNPTKSYKLNVVLPQIQHYSENSFANGAFPMIAVSSSNQLTFRNICGGVKLQFKGVDKIKSIKLEGIGGELISGKSTVVGYVNGDAPSITMHSGTAAKTVELDCGEGVQLNEINPVTFILAVPPVTFASGMKITVTDTDGMSRTLTNTSSNTVKRSSLLTFPVITYKQEGVFELEDGAVTSYELSAEGGTIEIPVVTNQDYKVVVPESAKDWISVVETKALRKEVVVLGVAANSTANNRSAEVVIISLGGETLQSISISQPSASSSVIDLSQNGTANCYIVSKAGNYKFTPTKGNSSESVGVIGFVETLWESVMVNTITATSKGSLVQDVSYSNGCIFFNTPETFEEGNAVIAAKDQSGTILWSWHIWLTDQPEELEYPNNIGIMMDRNLGAISVYGGQYICDNSGLFYQWGRKDPFLPYAQWDGTALKSSLSWPKPVNTSATYGTVDYAVKNPTVFILNTNEKYGGDWLYNSNSSLWASEKTIYDPCPVGWRVPDADVWMNADFRSLMYQYSKKYMSFKIKTSAGEYVAYYSLPGYRNATNTSAKIINCGYNGLYWSVTPDNSHEHVMGLYLRNDGRLGYQSSDNQTRADGGSVRCLKE